MLEASCREAEAVLLDRRYFALSADAFQEIPSHARPPAKKQSPVAALAPTKAPSER